MNKKFAIAIHGGAGTILKSTMTKEKEDQYVSALKEAINIGYKILEDGGTSLDAVEEAVVSLEDCPLFNAGKGSVFTHNGIHEMDASIMDGRNIDAGAVSLIKNIKNPVRLARKIMEKSEHVILAGDGAEEFARQFNIEFADKKYFYSEFRYDQLQKALQSDSIFLDHTELDHKFGTVGAVALDQMGNLAASTSTGGMTNKKWGRIGDTPIIGAGTYANNETCAISCTGSGEYFIRTMTAFHVHSLMKYGNYNLDIAIRKVIHEILPSIGGDGGLIAIDNNGNVVMDFNTEGMYRAWKKGGENGNETENESVLIY
ncbi:MAG: isoaspartyl peptidase/L-asparaginase [Saprospiraceae bacterium]|nr:isoaspartyl peptidase/L-asparaginase [Saprospiraceae bacterium]